MEALLTCRELLDIPILRHAAVRSGSNGLSKVVSRVNVMEVPDVVQWVRSGEFLITTGYSFRDRPEVLLELIPQLVERGVAAIGIKTKRYLVEIPQEVLAIAEQLELPIIELPPDTAFSDVVRQVMEQVLLRESHKLSLLQDRIHHVTKALIEGKGIVGFLECLEAKLGNPVVLLDSARRSYLSHGAERLVRKGDLCMESIWKCSGNEYGYGIHEVGERTVRYHTSHMNGREGLYPRLVLFEWLQDWNVLDTLTVDRALALAAIELMNEEAVRMIEAKYIDQFLQDWLTGKMVTSSDLMLRAETCGCPVPFRESLQCMILYMDSKSTIKAESLVREFRRSRATSSISIAVTFLHGDLVFVAGSDGQSAGTLAQSVADWMESELQRHGVSAPFSLCTSASVVAPSDVPAAYQEARKVRNISEACHLQRRILTMNSVGVYSLLHLLADAPDACEYMERQIGTILDYDRKHDCNLERTLTTYFACRRNTKATAEALYTHYNTVVYRLEKIRSLLGIDLDDAEKLLELQVALKLRIMKKLEASDG